MPAMVIVRWRMVSFFRFPSQRDAVAFGYFQVVDQRLADQDRILVRILQERPAMIFCRSG